MPTARVPALLEILQSGGSFSVADLAGRLGVDERTIRRYATHLLDLGIPVEARRGRYGGYRLAPGYKLPPLMLTDEEAVAIVLGLAAGRRAGLVTADHAATESATAKLRRVLPAALARRIDALLATMDVTGPVRHQAPPGIEVLLVLAEAARHRHPVSTYRPGSIRPDTSLPAWPRCPTPMMSRSCCTPASPRHSGGSLPRSAHSPRSPLECG
ncbi:hypothetical protein ACTI_43610 [Actinoplanes sp. OR16]|uniref:helix-turn-helix transcriptional regulator n=1 Tax=Actinoplanes sp. OR16 TaxID=946334 RepID=UPI000F6D7579|nr:hypothetical protein ACTI_43610 [Actinoplanes sp. OR16]